MPSRLPLRRLVKPPERATRYDESGRLGHHMVIGRRAPALEGGQEALVPVDLADGGDIVLERAAVPLQPSRRRRTQTHEISRMPTSMPLAQFTPVATGLARHHERSCASISSA